jgi:type IV secretory pathway TraG/TraD family ATPase VirD4
MTLQPVKRAQQMIFVRIQQIATARDRMVGALRTVCVIADEAKYHISRPVLQGLGASRDKGMRVVLAFQSFTDLKDCPADMNPDMVVGAVVENTPAKMIYKIEDPDTADWFARRSGVILVDDETRVLDKNIALAETTGAERSIRQAEHFLFDSNKLTNLTAGWAVLFGKGLAQSCYVSPYRVTKCVAAITPVQTLQELPENDKEAMNQENSPSPTSTSPKQHRDDNFFNLG